MSETPESKPSDATPPKEPLAKGRTSHRKAVPDEVIVGRNGMRIEFFRDGTEAMREKGYLDNLELSYAERIELIESLRAQLHGHEATHPRLSQAHRGAE
ncbi:MAG: hypothetical protein AAF823_03325 [Planctomycetota bacterium]